MWLLESIELGKMHNLKSRIKRRKQGMTKHGHDLPSSSTASVGAEWEFLNFNPFVYGPKRTASTESNPNVSLLRATQSSHEDFYEFPTSTKLPPPREAGSGAAFRSDAPQLPPPPLPLPPTVLRRKETPTQRLLNDPRYRHSLHSTFDLFHPPLPHPQSPTSGSSTRGVGGVAEPGQNPVLVNPGTSEVDNGGGKSSGSIFYLPSPSPPSQAPAHPYSQNSKRNSLSILDTPNSTFDSCPPLIPLQASASSTSFSSGKNLGKGCSRSDSGIGTMTPRRSPPLPPSPLTTKNLEVKAEVKELAKNPPTSPKTVKIKSPLVLRHSKSKSKSSQGPSKLPLRVVASSSASSPASPSASSPGRMKSTYTSAPFFVGVRGNGLLGLGKMSPNQPSCKERLSLDAGSAGCGIWIGKVII